MPPNIGITIIVAHDSDNKDNSSFPILFNLCCMLTNPPMIPHMKQKVETKNFPKKKRETAKRAAIAASDIAVKINRRLEIIRRFLCLSIVIAFPKSA
jgi:hypothetical protein